MPRPAGTRNADYPLRRAELIARIERRLVDPPDRPPMSALAEAAGASIPTLKHYFGDRDGVIDAILADGAERGRRFIAVAAEPSGDLPTSMQDLAHFVLKGFAKGRLGDLHAIGFTEALRHPERGRTYLAHIMDPMIDAVAERLSKHMQRAEMTTDDPRQAAIGFLGPLFLAVLHQDEFGGAEHRPMDLAAFGATHAAAFVRAHQA